MKIHTILVSGMTCESCVQSVANALKSIAGVKDVQVSLADGEARVTAEDGVREGDLVRAVREAGYGVAFGMPPENAEAGNPLRIVIIGSGSGAFACAIRAAERRGRVTMIERDTLGGTCVNVGCVPSKILIRQAHIAHQAVSHPFPGIVRVSLPVDARLLEQQRKARVLELRDAKYKKILESIPNIALLQGEARFKTARTLEVRTPGGVLQTVEADRIVIATGASPVCPDTPGLSGTPYWTSKEALFSEKVPTSLIILGGGYVGVELAQAYRRLGSRVTLLTRSALLPKYDPDIGEILETVFREEGMEVRTRAPVKSVDCPNGGFVVTTQTEEVLTAEHLLVAVGRTPNTGGLSLAIPGVDTDASGAIRVNEFLETSVSHIFAIGDCTTLPAFVYVAAQAGTRAADNLFGARESLDLSVLPSVVFTDPQVALVGLSEAEARKRGMDVESRTLSMDNVPRALANFETRGFVRLVAERGSGRLLGAQIVSDQAGEMIQTAALALRNNMTVQQLGDQLFPYLTMVEGIRLCAQSFTKDVGRLSCCAG